MTQENLKKLNIDKAIKLLARGFDPFAEHKRIVHQPLKERMRKFRRFRAKKSPKANQT